MEALDHDQYWVKVDGSGRLTLRNRRFLRAFTPATPAFEFRATPDPFTSETPFTTPPQPGLTVPAGLPPPSTERNVVQAESSPGDLVNQVNPPADSSETLPSGLTVSQDAPVPITPMQQLNPSSSVKERRRRAPHPRKFFEPESGTWVNH